jgi:hypothetical protein
MLLAKQSTTMRCTTLKPMLMLKPLSSKEKADDDANMLLKAKKAVGSEGFRYMKAIATGDSRCEGGSGCGSGSRSLKAESRCR